MTGSDLQRPEGGAAGSAEELEALLLYLKQSRGFDFTAYKRSGLMRRVLVRMQTVGISRFTEYQDYLQVDPEEFTRLFNTILINVTAFFRDTPSWDHVAEHVLPTVVGRDGGTQPVRVWSAGCASGEEAYTIAMLLAERLGPEQFRERVKIYATDVDEDALNQARQASYGTRGVEGIPPDFLVKYFDFAEGRYVFNRDLRRSVIFGRHDLIQDAPISRVNLLVCRNCLMYFNAEAQSRILSRFHFALVDGGTLFLGKAETLLAHTTIFSPLDVKRRLFTKVERTHLADRPALFDPVHTAPDEHNHGRLRDGVSELSPVALLLVDANGVVLQANARMRSLFGLTDRDLGRQLQDLEVSYRPYELRSCIDRAYSEGRPIQLGEGTWTTQTGESLNVELQVVPISDGNDGFSGVGVFYSDVTKQRKLQDEVRRSNQELETALEELQTINEEARDRGDELGELNAFLESILTSLRGGVLVVDADLRVHKWNHRAEDMWGLRSDEVLNKNFFNLDIGLPVDRLRAPIQACLARETEHMDTVVDATNRRGKAIRVKVTCSPLLAARRDTPGGVILVIDEVEAREKG